MITRGTTSLIECSLPFEVSNLSVGFITIVQRNKTVIEKELKDCDVDGKTINILLTQEETLSLDHTVDAEVQFTGKTKDNKRVTSDIEVESIGRILKEGVI